ncbi:Translation factor GUF1-like protein, mitochondrial [Smittium culicis]|uniref:Translation factor GUF1-like protein, mitochondrial n=1 Tax=Smittium culicis TaxID=133412 RepID=A0A1R1XA84_9FUNG|nr:Translation factor GUF1-like protein, mitochondrial [Smittium culicis]
MMSNLFSENDIKITDSTSDPELDSHTEKPTIKNLIYAYNDKFELLQCTISSENKNMQVLDKLQVERERGITVKAQSASMFYSYKGKNYLLNLIDTPGHVDFSYEVSRSLAACQGTILLVDAAQGIQAQTVANFYLAFSQDLKIVPVLNKVDLPGAEPEKVEEQMRNAFDLDENHILRISAKSGLNIEKVLQTVIDDIPAPTGDINLPLKALLFDSWYDTYAGVICLISVVDGNIKKGDKIVSAHTGEKYEVNQVGIMYPEMKKTNALNAGQVGYVVCNMKSILEAHVGDTFYWQKNPVDSLPGFKQPKPMVFAGLFPSDTIDFEKLQDAIDQLTLNDSSVSVNKENSNALGQGWRLGFLGTLHMDVFRQRLENEYEVSVILSHPTVPYKIITKDGAEKIVKSPADFPSKVKLGYDLESLLEPFVNATIIVPNEYVGAILKLCSFHRGVLNTHTYIDETRVMISVRLPSSEIVTDFYDKLKSHSSGFASLDYEEAGYEEADLVKMEVLLNTEPVDALATIVHRSRVETDGRDIAKKLKDLIKRQLFEITIQTTANGKVVARETYV